MYLHPSELRVANTRRIFRLLLSGGACSRAELSRRSGLSPVTAGKVVDELIATKLAAEFEPERAAGSRLPGPMGRPPRMVTLSLAPNIPVIELGVRETRFFAASLAPSPPPRGVAMATPARESALFASLGRARRGLQFGTPPLLLVSVPGVLDGRTNEILFSPNLRWTCRPGFLRRLSAPWRTRLCAVQEIQALALGHQASEDAPDSFVLVDFGDGVGGAVITGGQLLQGPLPLCGEIGHTEVFGNRRTCGCGSTGCLETLVSRRGLLQSFRAATRRPRATWEELRESVNAKGVGRWLGPSIDAAAGVIAGAINMLGIQDVVLTGDMPDLHPDMAGIIGERIERHALVGRFARLRCVAAERRRIRGLIAAAADRVLLPEPALLSGPERGVAG